MASLTTSYFGLRKKHLEKTKISIARFNPPKITGKVEILSSFAPSAHLLRAYKSKEIDWTQYSKSYCLEQENHYAESSEDFKNLLQRATLEDIVLLCYERFDGPNTKCHRILLYDLLKTIAKKEGSSVNFVDEA